MKKNILSVGVCVFLFLFCAEFLSAKVICGYSIYPIIETPHPYPVGGPHAPIVWSKIIFEPGATWLKVHFLAFELDDEDYIDLIDMDGNIRERIKGIDIRIGRESRFKSAENPDGTISFWGPSIDGDTINIELHSVSTRHDRWGIIIDEIGIGFLPIEEEGKAHILSICGSDDKKDVACYEGTLKYTRAEAVGRMLFKEGVNWVKCTGFLVSCTGTNHFLSNQHCADSQSEVDTLEVRFHYQYTTCGGQILGEYETYYGDDFIESHYTYDYSLMTIKDNPQDIYGYLIPIHREPYSAESIYIPQHPGGGPKEISECGVNNKSVPSPRDQTPNTDFNYYCDTEPGSSGSPVIANRNLHQVLGLHHWGGCPNIAVKMSKIYPLIRPDIDCNHAPAAPSDLIATPTAYNQINLSWQDNSYNEDGFKIERGTSPTQLLQIATVGIDQNYYHDKSCQMGVTYYYRVRAYNTDGNSSYSNTASATIPTGVPAAPSNLRGICGAFEVQLTWHDNSSNEAMFPIERKTDWDPWEEIGAAGPNDTIYYDRELPYAEILYYRIRAYNQYGYSSYSNIARVVCIGYPLFSLKIIPSKAIIKSGESITYTYVLENNGKTEIVNINLLDNKFGIIASGFSLKKGETKTFFKVVTLTETTTNLATATATYQQKNKMKTTEANAIATIEVEK
jgi:lysyl endopeptidase